MLCGFVYYTIIATQIDVVNFVGKNDLSNFMMYFFQ